MIAVLTGASIAPAQAGTSSESMTAIAKGTLPKVPVSDLLDPQGQPQLAQPDADTTDTTADQVQDQGDAQQAVEATPRPTGDLAAMVAQLRGPEPGSHELDCLATGIYFESKGEPLAGQLAVGQVIANRTQSGGRFPGTYCGVLFQHSQFSFVHGHSLPEVARSNSQWQTAVAIAKIVDQHLKDPVVGDAMFFHARYVSPNWRMKRVASIGNHIFFR